MKTKKSTYKHTFLRKKCISLKKRIKNEPSRQSELSLNTSHVNRTILEDMVYSKDELTKNV